METPVRWLAYLAPENLPLDLALQNSTTCFYNLPQLPLPRVFSAPSLSPLLRPKPSLLKFSWESTWLPPTPSPLKATSVPTARSPSSLLSEFFTENTDSIPEPSSALLLGNDFWQPSPLFAAAEDAPKFFPSRPSRKQQTRKKSNCSNLPKTTLPPIQGQ